MIWLQEPLGALFNGKAEWVQVNIQMMRKLQK